MLGPGQLWYRVLNRWPFLRYQSPPVPKARRVECGECGAVCTNRIKFNREKIAHFDDVVDVEKLKS